MKRTNYISLLTIMSFVLLSSCIDKDYNWDNLDKTAAVKVGNIPIGDVEKLTIESLLPDNLRADLKVTADGIFYLEYSGDIDVHDPETVVPTTDPVSISTITHTLPAASFQLPLNQELKVVENAPIEYTISEPYFNDADWEIMVTSVDFTACDFVLELAFSGVSFQDTGSAKSYIMVDILFPDNIKVMGESDNRITKSFNLSELNNGKITLPYVQLASIDYRDGVQNLVYSVSIVGGNNTQLTTGSGEFKFDLTFLTRNVEPNIIYGDASFNQVVEDRVADLQELNDSFLSDDVLKFDDIQFYLNLTTNLGANFTIGVNQLSTGNSTGQVSINNVTADNLSVIKPELNKERTTSYVLSKKNPNSGVTHIAADMTPLFGIIPAWLDYKISVRNDNIADKSVFYVYNNLKIDADYRIVLPFTFSEVDIHLADTLTNVFKDDLAEKLFFEPGEFKIVADEADVNFANTETEALKLIMQVSLLDEQMNKIDVEVEPVSLNNGPQPMEIKINIKESDIAKLQRAMHLSFDFDITNNPGKTLSIRNTDSVEIKGIKFQSSSGIKFDLE